MMELNLTRVDYLQVIVMKYSSLFFESSEWKRRWIEWVFQTAFVYVSSRPCLVSYTISACKHFILFICILRGRFSFAYLADAKSLSFLLKYIILWCISVHIAVYIVFNSGKTATSVISLLALAKCCWCMSLQCLNCVILFNLMASSWRDIVKNFARIGTKQ